MTSSVERSTAITSPLQSLQPSDVERTKQVLVDAQLFVESTRVAYMGVLEPPKAEVLALGPGETLDREIRVILTDVKSERSQDVVVNLTTATVASAVDIDGSAGKAPILHSRYEDVDEIVSADPRWIAALQLRGLTPAEVKPAANVAGDPVPAGKSGRRRIRIVPFLREDQAKNVWAHPIGGLLGYFDVELNQLDEVIDSRVFPVPRESGDYTDEAVTGPPLQTLRPISITQPEGTSFTVDGECVTWGNWSFRVGYDHREGLVLRQLAFDDFGTVRPIMYRGSISEMVVNYADPDPAKAWLNYFDVGEFVFGRYGNSLELGCDCLGEIHYFDAVLADENGDPRTISNAICMHEEDFSVLWKHTYNKSGERTTRRNRRLVVSFFTTVGNYDYGFYWYLYLDGTIECEAKLTGLLLQTPYPEEGSDYQTEVAPGLGAPYHQHLFSARLDMMVDGLSNAVDEVDARRIPMGQANPEGNSFGRSVTRLRTEREGARDADGAVGRVWRIVNTAKVNRTGAPVSYVLYPQPTPTLLADPSSTVYSRAGFATKHLWVTRYAPDERYPAGEYVNQNPGGDGLPKYTAADRDIDGQDIVLWHTFGPTHMPRIEDWPVMPVDMVKFTLKPVGFFDKNPALNIPESTTSGHHHGNGDGPHACSCHANGDSGHACTCHGNGSPT